jgi:hypothetical protein
LNYQISPSDVSGATILARGIYGYGANKVYNGTTTASVTLSDTISGDVISTVANFSDRFVGSSKSIKVSELSNMYCVITQLSSNVMENPFFIVYTTPTGTGDAASWYHTKLFYGENDLPVNVDKSKPILLYTGTDNTSIHPEIESSNRQQLRLNSSFCNPTTITDAVVSSSTDEINLISLQTSSQQVSYNKYNFICSEIGLRSSVYNETTICATGEIVLPVVNNSIVKSILNTDQTIYADGAQGTVVTGTPYGWAYSNADSNAALKKINWYYFSKQTSGKLISGSLTGTDSGNYSLYGIYSADITVKSISTTPNSKIYDRTNSATFVLSGVETVDTSNVSVSGNYLRITVGTDISATATISGTMAYNYNLATINNGSISGKHITGSAADKTYNASDVASVTLSGVISPDTVTVTATFSDIDVSSNKPVTGSISGADSGNYILDSISNASITQKSITGTSVDRYYDITTNVTVNLNNVETFDLSNVTLAGSMTDKLVGNNKTVSGSLSGSRAFNYLLSSISNVSISSKIITGTAADKSYDASTVATISLSGIISPDVVNVTGEFANKNVGTVKSVTGLLSGTDAGNYSLSSVSTANITTKPITGTSVDRIYDRTTNVTVNLNDVEASDISNVTLSGSMINKSVGNNKTVSGLLEGSEATNYSLTSISTVNITTKSLTGTTSSKTYDASRDANIVLSGVISGDTVTISGQFDNKNIGTNKSVTGSLSGTDASNYTLSSVSNADINIRSLTGKGRDRAYNGSTDIVVDLSNTIVSDDISANGVINSKNIGSRVVLLTNLLGVDASNYSIGAVDNAVISTKNITANAQNKVYSASTVTDISLNNIESGDAVTGVANFVSRTVANSIAIDISSVVLSGLDRNNYNVTSVTSANITPLTLNATGQNKVYDGTTDAVIVFNNLVIVDLSGEDDVQYEAVFDSRHASPNKSIKVSELSNMYCVITQLSSNVMENPFFIVYTTPTGTGDAASWYHTKLFYGSNDLPSNVDKTRPILLYTGTDDTSIHPEIQSSNRQQLQLNSSLCNPTTITNAVVSSSTDEINLISLQTSSQQVSYNKYNFICSEMGLRSSVYNETTICATGEIVLPVVNNGIVKSILNTDQSIYADGAQGTVVTGTPYGWAYSNADSNAALRKINWYYFNKQTPSKTISGVLTGGVDRNNYVLGAISNADITKLNISGTGYPKTYNGSTTASVILNGVLNIDTSNVSVSAVFDNRHVGTGKTISGSISGSSSGNYNLTNISSSNINVLNITGYTQDKVYDRLTTATVDLPDILIIDGSVTANADFSNKDVSSNVSVSGSLVGSNASNYAVTFTTANITKKPLTAVAGDKVYNSSTDTSFTLYGVISPDNVSAIGTYNTANVGINKASTASLTGSDSDNYSLSNSDISGGEVSVKSITGTGINKVYDRTVDATVILNDVETVDISNIGCDASFNNRLVGSSKPITGVLSGASAYNYLLTGISTADITVKSLTGSASNKTYNGSDTASVTLSGVVPGDIVNVSGTFSDIFAEDNKAVYAIISGTDSSNYILPSNSVSRATINRKGIFGTGLSKDYDGLTFAIVDISNELVSVNNILDSVNVTALFANKNVGTTISISGSINGPHAYNYTLSGIYPANIRPKQITAVGNNKVYDNTTAATTTLSGVIPADVENVVAPIGIFTDKFVDTNITISLTNSISGSESSNYNLINNTTSADITPKALTVDWHVHNKTYDGTNSAVVYYTSISGLFVTDGVVFIDSFEASFDNAEAGFVKSVSIVNVELSGPKSYNYYAPDSTINGSILSKGSNLFINNGLTINQNTGLYSEEQNVESDLNFDYVVLFNVSALTGVNNNMTNIFSNAHYIQNSENAEDVNIQLSIPNHNGMGNMTYNWNEINQQNIITISRGRATVGFGTFFAEPVKFGETLLEIMAHKIFGHAQARSAISNDDAFNEHDVQLWDHLSSSVGNKQFQLSVFNQYVTSGRYSNDENQTIESGDTLLNKQFNFQGMTFDFPLFLNGSLLVDDQLVNETSLLRNGVNVGGAQIVNGLYNIPILLRFHD